MSARVWAKTSTLEVPLAPANPCMAWFIALIVRTWRKMSLAFFETPERYRSEEHTSELQSLMRISYAVFCLKKKKQTLPHIDVIGLAHMKNSHIVHIKPKLINHFRQTSNWT